MLKSLPTVKLKIDTNKNIYKFKIILVVEIFKNRILFIFIIEESISFHDMKFSGN